MTDEEINDYMDKWGNAFDKSLNERIVKGIDDHIMKQTNSSQEKWYPIPGTIHAALTLEQIVDNHNVVNHQTLLSLGWKYTPNTIVWNK